MPEGGEGAHHSASEGPRENVMWLAVSLRYTLFSPSVYVGRPEWRQEATPPLLPPSPHPASLPPFPSALAPSPLSTTIHLNPPTQNVGPILA